VQREGFEVRGVTGDVMLEGFVWMRTRAAARWRRWCGAGWRNRPVSGAAAQAARSLDLHAKLTGEIDARQVREEYARIEMPLRRCSRAWSERGAGAPEQLRKLSGEMEAGIDRLSASSMRLPGTRSTSTRAAVGKVLFEEMGLPAPARRGKTNPCRRRRTCWKRWPPARDRWQGA
jgi:hypothetical protein